MRRWPKVTISIGQAVIAVAVFVLAKYCHDNRTYAFYVGPALHTVVKMNFPLVVVLFPALSLSSWIASYASPPIGLLRSVEAIFFTLVLASVVALFWYFVVAEIEKRRQGKSILRFGGLLIKAITLAVLFACGIGAIWYAYADGALLIRTHGSKIETFVGGLFLLIWGSVLIGIAISDLLSYIRTPRQAGGPP